MLDAARAGRVEAVLEAEHGPAVDLPQPVGHPLGELLHPREVAGRASRPSDVVWVVGTISR